MVALTLPDIAGKIDDPQKASGARYIDWVEKYLTPTYTLKNPHSGAAHVFLNGGDCYALRCAFLHEGSDDVSKQRAAQALEKFQFVAPKAGMFIHKNQVGKKLQLQVDVFSRDVVASVKTWQSQIPPSDSVRLTRIKSLAEIQTLTGTSFVI